MDFKDITFIKPTYHGHNSIKTITENSRHYGVKIKAIPNSMVVKAVMDIMYAVMDIMYIIVIKANKDITDILSWPLVTKKLGTLWKSQISETLLSF
jgi:hypothetical protein